MDKDTALTISLILLCVGILFCSLTYIVFHFLGRRGFEKWSPTARKPLVSQMFATFAVLSLFSALLFLLIGLVG